MKPGQSWQPYNLGYLEGWLRENGRAEFEQRFGPKNVEELGLAHKNFHSHYQPAVLKRASRIRR